MLFDENICGRPNSRAGGTSFICDIRSKLGCNNFAIGGKKFQFDISKHSISATLQSKPRMSIKICGKLALRNLQTSS